MARDQRGRRRDEDDTGDEHEREEPDDRQERRNGHREGLSVQDAAELVGRAKEQLTVLTGHRVEAVSGLTPDGDGWRLTVDAVELSRIPPSTDVLASYDVELDRRGNLVGYERTRRYVRSQADEY